MSSSKNSKRFLRKNYGEGAAISVPLSPLELRLDHEDADVHVMGWLTEASDPIMVDGETLAKRLAEATGIPVAAAPELWRIAFDSLANEIVRSGYRKPLAKLGPLSLVDSFRGSGNLDARLVSRAIADILHRIGNEVETLDEDLGRGNPLSRPRLKMTSRPSRERLEED